MIDERQRFGQRHPETLDRAALHLALDAEWVDGLAHVLDDDEVVQLDLAGVGIDFDPGQLGAEGRRLLREGRMADAEDRRHLRHVQVALLTDLGQRDAAIGHAAHHHALVLDLEVLDRRFHLLGRDLERLLARVLGGFHHRHADGVDGLAAGAEPGDGSDIRVAGGDPHLVHVDAV